MLRNILAIIGLYLVGKKGLKHYQRYDYYKKRAESLEAQIAKFSDKKA